jgi:hypothetical protein
MRRWAWLTLLGWTGFEAAAAGAEPFSREQLEYFEKKIRPLLAENCHGCHGPQKQKGKLRLDSRAGVLKGGESGPAIVSGAPAKSLLHKAIGYEEPTLRMPPRGKLSAEQIADLTAWIAMGAPWPDDAAIHKTAAKEFNLKERSRHWSTSFSPGSRRRA